MNWLRVINPQTKAKAPRWENKAVMGSCSAGNMVTGLTGFAASPGSPGDKDKARAGRKRKGTGLVTRV